ncbi:MAG: hypothetical protein KC425_25320 [Anaerolineales bacterium]|nr:hypothetical protein [Anaerolineales bacterium]
MPPLDVLCIGQATYDLAFAIPHYPAADEKSVATGLTASGGGPAANAAVAVARLGGRSGFAGYLGRDAFGDLHAQELRAEGVDISLLRRGAAPTPLSVVWVQPDGRRALVNYRAETPPLPAGSVTLTAVPPAVLLFDGLESAVSPALADAARRQGVPTVLDAGSLRRGTADLLPRVTYAVVSARFSQEFTGQADPHRALARLAAVAPRVVITLGARGLVWRTPEGAGEMAAPDVSAVAPGGIVDTNGAGDAFHGAFAYGVARGMAWQPLLRYASAAAALTCTGRGARPALPTQAQVAALLGN